MSDHPPAGPPPFVRALSGYGERIAVITADGRIGYAELAARVEALAARLGPQRRLVLLAGANRVDELVAYLAALAGGHPLLLTPGDAGTATAELIRAYDPDVLIRRVDGKLVVTERHAGTRHDLHPELALLLSTSGSTGSPKLVRLSATNLQANAESIAAYLDIRDTDRAATTLPLHYCYGLSVVNSHLLRGAALVLTGRSVTDPEFWELFRSARGTSLAGVPYTFDLLDRVGFDRMRLPHLRHLTQAGGRLDPERVTRYAALGRRQGWRLFVMYGQTEATARMAYLPPELATRRPEAIGVPVPGGSFRLRPLPGHPAPDTGELVYTGPNVMLGYAEEPADLALGRTVTELHTGDVARRGADGLYEIVGRTAGFVKIFGLRVDPRRVEEQLRRAGVEAYCVGTDRELVVAATGGHRPEQVRRLAARAAGLPARTVRAHLLPELPRLANGKPDLAAVRALAPPAPADHTPTGTDLAPAGTDTAALCRLYADLLDRPEVHPDQSFVDLGGDSLSYVTASVRLAELLGDLPTDWPTRPIRELARPTAAPPGRRRTLETTVALRTLAIVAIVGSHIPVFTVKGGAHLLLAVAGFHFARFQLTAAPRRQRVRAALRATGRLVLPSVAWIAVAGALTGDYTLTNVLLLNSVLGPHDGATQWHFWFLEALVYLLLAATALIAVPAVDRLDRRHPFGLPLALAGLGLVTRYDLPGLAAYGPVPDALTVGWLFPLGWAAARAAGTRQRLLVTAVAAGTVPGLFGQPYREAFVVAGFALLAWVPRLPGTPLVNRVAGALAASSLLIYLTHWQVLPVVGPWSGWLALAVSLAVGVAATGAVRRATRRASWAWAGRAARRASRAWAGPASWAALRRSVRAADGQRTRDNPDLEPLRRRPRAPVQLVRLRRGEAHPDLATAGDPHER
ncbi:Acyl-CoA synthetase (AMP-forming)/AMP-acid ligase II [Micromonospora auratinigra]|uniref:Acyl-CoA synthetase (AMP-forming)/AMP-acid ligase II n=1 Tax=Micromonospora auratinigra TaxID=261654 RepID=A0A1A8Z8Q7_9ACTN|nr:AMP-binding protein [Micromonospora auratinigra]SBT40341.1 Acyl-CoA synthetase (AMP-forming)/AMP-acid ligase II [Micromonospora auratinigra]